MVRDPNVRCIMAAIGGNISNSLLPYLEYEGLCKDPKIIVGYSDVTALLLGIYEMCIRDRLLPLPASPYKRTLLHGSPFKRAFVLSITSLRSRS